MSNVLTATRSSLLRCKERALKFVDAGDYRQALDSMFSDLSKHPETENHPAIQFGFLLMISGNLTTEYEVRDFIKGFN